MADTSQMQKECERLEARNREIDEMFLKLYADKAKGLFRTAVCEADGHYGAGRKLTQLVGNDANALVV